MKTFTDNTGRTWTLSVTVGTIKRVRALCGVDLANIITMESGKTPNVGLLEHRCAFCGLQARGGCKRNYR